MNQLFGFETSPKGSQLHTRKIKGIQNIGSSTATSLSGWTVIFIWRSGQEVRLGRISESPSSAPRGQIGAKLLFLILEGPIHFFDATITGTTVVHLGDKHIRTIQFAAPPEELLVKVSSLFDAMGLEQLNLKRRNQTLRQTRDLLLPKLLSTR